MGGLDWFQRKRLPQLGAFALSLVAAAALGGPFRSTPAPSAQAQVGGTHPNRSFVVCAPLDSLEDVARRHGLAIARVIGGIEAAVLVGPGPAPEVLARLRSDPLVRSATPDLPFQVSGAGCMAQPGELTEETFAAEAERLERQFGPVRDLGPGSPLTWVAVLDTGADAGHEAIEAALVPGRSFLDAARWDEDPSGHGTAMASLVAGRRHAGHGLSGVAEGVCVLPVQVADRAGRARLSDVAAGLVYAVDQGASVVLLSLGGPLPAPALTEALDYAEERGVVVVAAAGNVNTHVDLQPAADPRVLSAACVDDLGRLAFSTTLAPTTDVVLPGVQALAALPRGGHGHVTGSSVAAARLAGVVARLRELAPDLTPAALRGLLRGARRPLFHDDPDLARAFPVGSVDLGLTLERLAARAPAPVLADPRVLPARARPGDPVVASARLENRGLAASAPQTITVSVAGEPVATLAAPALAPGEQVGLRWVLAAPPSDGPVPVEFRAADGSAVAAALAPTRSEARDLAIAGLVAEATPTGGLVVTATVEGRGARRELASVELRLGEHVLGPTAVGPLGPGQTGVASFELDPRALGAVPDGVRTLEVRLAEREADDRPHDDAAFLDVELHPALAEGEGRLRTQYQQSGELNVIADAPWRLAPGRPYLPVLLFVPEKGDLEQNTYVELDRVTVTARLAPGKAGGHVVYDDVRGGATHAPAGAELLDEDGGVVRTAAGVPDVRAFGHARLTRPGHYTVLRLPSGAFGAAPGADAYVEVRTAWTNRRRFLYVFRATRQGTTRKVLRVRFAAAQRPTAPGGGRFFDAHVHTITEWYQSQTFDPLAPRKAWGGPLPMLGEAAYALGMIERPDAVRDRVITTDHNAFYVAGDRLRDRPAFGPTSAARSAGRSEWERAGELFGMARGEEVTFSASNAVASWLKLPTGSHLLSYRAQHVDGPWHGGSALARVMGDGRPDVELVDVLTAMAKTNAAENARAAVYAAHPHYGTNAWSDEHFELAFERDRARRTDRVVLASGDGFVTKGSQLWNGHFGRRNLPSKQIRWDDLDPWADATFQQGNPDWDDELYRGLGAWHRDLAALMRYELARSPGVVFPRKLFASAGSDAHGDFNLTEDRMAAIVGAQSTFLVDGSAFGAALTHALPGLQPAGAVTADEEAFEAFLDGNSVLTDGPVVTFSLDAEDRFAAGSLQWRDRAPGHHDADGRIGGGGAFDGYGTALVRRGSPNVRLGYRYASTPEFGDVQRLALYRTSAGDPNPMGTKPSGSAFLVPRGGLAAGGAGQDHEEPLDPAEEGLIASPTALQVGAYTGDPATLGPEGARCLTNPVWCVPFDVDATIARTEVDAAGRGTIPAGALEVRFAFDASLEPAAYTWELKALDAQGDSTPAHIAPLDALAAAGPGTGWADRGAVRDAALTLTNTRPIPLHLDRYGSGPDQVTLVLYSVEPLRDAFGNALNRVAVSFEATGIGTGGGTGPVVGRAAPGSTAAGATGGSLPAPRGRSAGCALGRAADGGAPLAPLALLLGLLVALRARPRRR